MSGHLRLEEECLRAVRPAPKDAEPCQDCQLRPRVPWSATRQEPALLGSRQGCHGLKIQVNSLAQGCLHLPLRVAAHGDVQIDANGLPRGPASVHIALQIDIHAAILSCPGNAAQQLSCPCWWAMRWSASAKSGAALSIGIECRLGLRTGLERVSIHGPKGGFVISLSLIGYGRDAAENPARCRRPASPLRWRFPAVRRLRLGRQETPRKALCPAPAAARAPSLPDSRFCL